MIAADFMDNEHDTRSQTGAHISSKKMFTPDFWKPFLNSIVVFSESGITALVELAVAFIVVVVAALVKVGVVFVAHA